MEAVTGEAFYFVNFNSSPDGGDSVRTDDTVNRGASSAS